MKTKLLILSVLALFFHATSWAYDFKAGGIYYNILSEEDLTCKVTYLSTSNSNYSAYQGSVEIPNTVEYGNTTYTVTTIGYSAFSGCSGLTSVTIPESVTTISDAAFWKCSGLTEVTISNSVTSIGSSAFQGCSDLTVITIPENVTTIGDWAFTGCTGLAQVNYNAIACTSVCSSTTYYAFNNCTNISTLNFGDKVTIIPKYLCYKLTSLTGKLAIPNSVSTIEYGAFYGCSGLEEVTIPNSVTSIGQYAFRDCSRLAELIIGNSVTAIDTDAFRGCSKLTNITSLNPEPPTCKSSNYGVVFEDVDLRSCILYVPDGTLEAYANASTWKLFYNIKEIEVDAIAGITTDCNAETVGYYTTDGKQVPTLRKGVNIIRYSDGTARKVLVK